MRWRAPVELGGVEAQGLVEGGALVIVQVHGHVHAQAEEAAPPPVRPVLQELRAGGFIIRVDFGLDPLNTGSQPHNLSRLRVH